MCREPKITFNLFHCGRTAAEGLMHTMLHEMTHARQFASGGTGGHGPDFRSEMIRVGIIEDPDGTARCRYGSAADRLLKIAAREQADLPARIRALAGLSPASLRLAEETAFETVLAIR